MKNLLGLRPKLSILQCWIIFYLVDREAWYREGHRYYPNVPDYIWFHSAEKVLDSCLNERKRYPVNVAARDLIAKLTAYLAKE